MKPIELAVCDHCAAYIRDGSTPADNTPNDPYFLIAIERRFPADRFNLLIDGQEIENSEYDECDCCGQSTDLDNKQLAYAINITRAVS